MTRTSVWTLATMAALALAWVIPANASQYKVIYTFQGGNDGEQPYGPMISDAAGNLYGTTEFGGSQKLGTVFKLAPGSGGTWTETVLYNFSEGTDGGQPQAGLVMDASGNLYGTTTAGGDPTCLSIHGFCGVVFKLTANSDGTWSESALVNFTGSNGLDPEAGLTFDNVGNLYGTAIRGGQYGYGIVFQLSPNSDGTWTENILYSFNQNEAAPNSQLVFDSAGNLYGTTNAGGVKACDGFGCGTVFKLTQSGGTWSTQILLALNGKSGANPLGVVFDSAGNLYGAAANGAAGNCNDFFTTGCGSVFRLTPSGGQWTSQVVYQFANHTAANPQSVIVDSSGNIYGTTLFGGLKDCDQNLETCGTIYKLAPAAGGGWKVTGLYEFHGGTDGSWPYAGLTMDNAGNLYGTTGSGGDLSCEAAGGCGVVFQIIP